MRAKSGACCCMPVWLFWLKILRNVLPYLFAWQQRLWRRGAEGQWFDKWSFYRHLSRYFLKCNREAVFIDSHFPEVVAMLFWGYFPPRLCSLALYSVLHFSTTRFLRHVLYAHLVHMHIWDWRMDERIFQMVATCSVVIEIYLCSSFETIESGNFYIFFIEYI